MPTGSCFPRGKDPPVTSNSNRRRSQLTGPVVEATLLVKGPPAKHKREAWAAVRNAGVTAASSSPSSQPAGTDTPREGPDFLFGNSSPKKKPVSLNNGLNTQHSKEATEGFHNEASKLTQAVGLGCVTKIGRAVPQISPICLKQMVRGTAVLGVVIRVGPKDVSVALPGGLSGRVPLVEVSDPFFSRFSPSVNGTISDPVSEKEDLIKAVSTFLRPGQVVRAVVSSSNAASRKQSAGGAGSGGRASQKVPLTLRASAVNRGLKLEHVLPGGALMGAVASVEDHGYVVSTGLEGVTAFLARKHVKGGAEVEKALVKGSPVEIVVLDVKEASRAITCGFDPAVLPRALTRGSALTLAGLKPGMLVNAAIDAILKNGLALTFLGGLSGVVSLEHLDRPYAENDWRKRYRLGDILQVRVLMVDVKSKSVYLTLRAHLLGMRAPSGLPELGQVLSEAKVLRVDPTKGLVLGFLPPESVNGGTKDIDTCEDEGRIEEELSGRRAKRVRAKEDGEDDGSNSKLKDEPSELLREKILQRPRYVPVFVHASQIESLASVSVGQTVACRVIGSAPVEGAVHGSMRVATMDAPFVRLADVQPGQLVRARVAAVAGWGLTLDLGQGIRAHCTNMHLTDGAGSKSNVIRAKALTEAKKGKTGKSVYQAGQEVTCRILQVDTLTRKVYATMKPSLLKDTPGGILNAYTEAIPGKKCLGFVTKVEDFGVIVTFFDNVHGLLPLKHLAAQGVSNPTHDFRLGQVLRCVVTSCAPQRRPPRLSLRLDVHEEAGMAKSPESARQPGAVSAGDSVSGTVVRVQEPFVVVKLDGHGSTEPLAFLHKHQLGDHAALADQFLARTKMGDRIESALVLEFRRDSNEPLLSLKPLLVRAGGGIVDQAPDSKLAAKKGPCFAKPPRLQDLKIGRARLCGYISRVESFGLFVRFVGGQTAMAPRALIADRFVDDASGLFREGDSVRCLLHRVDADKDRVFVTTQRSQLPVTDSFFLETLLLESVSTIGIDTEESEVFDWQRFALGATVNATVTAVKDYGIVLSGEDHRTVMLAPGPDHVLACAPNDEVKVRVLDVDWAKRVLVVTMLPELVRRGRAKYRKTADGLSLQTGARGVAEIVLKRDRYAVVEMDGALAYLAVADYQCPYLATGNLELGVNVDVVVRRPWRTGLGKKCRLSYPQEPIMLVTLAQEQDAAEKNQSGRVGPSKKFERERKRAQQEMAVDEKTPTAAEHRGSTKEGKRPKLDRAEKKTPPLHLERKQARPITTSQILVGAALPALVADVRPDELILTLNIQDMIDEPQPRGVLDPSMERKSNRLSAMRVLAKVFITHSGRQCLMDVEEAVGEALQAKLSEERGEVRHLSFHPLSQYQVGQELEVRVLDIREKELKKMKLLECSLRPQDVQASKEDLIVRQPTWDTLAVGTILLGVITEIQLEGLWVAVSRAVKGFVHYLDISRDGDAGVFSRMREAGAVGIPVPVIVLQVDAVRHRLQLSMRGVHLKGDVDPTMFPILPSSSSRSESGMNMTPRSSRIGCLEPNVGDILTGRVCLGPRAPLLNPPSVAIQLGYQVFGRLCITELDEPAQWIDQALARANSPLQDGKDVRCRVLSVAGERIDVSLRPSRLHPSLAITAATAEDPLPEEGSVTKGYVVGTSTKGCFVRLSKNVTARVLIKDLADGFITSPMEAFPVGKLVAGRVLRIEQRSGAGAEGLKIDLSLRPSVVVGESMHQMAFEDVLENTKVKGVVVRVEPFGVFIKIQNSELTGMCHISEVSDQLVKNLSEMYDPGDIVKALVLKVDATTKRISLSLKPSHFKEDKYDDDDNEGGAGGSGEEKSDQGGKDFVEDGAGESDEGVEEVDLSGRSTCGAKIGKEECGDVVLGVSMQHGREEMGGDMEVEPEEDSGGRLEQRMTDPRSSGAVPESSFQWEDFDLGVGGGTDGQDKEYAFEGEESIDKESKSQGRIGSKTAMRKRDQERLREQEERLLDADTPPESVEDFERLVLANPNSSLIWIRYMAFQLSLADVDAARALAERALQTIVFREESEKLNVWVARLNLEHRYGNKVTVLAVLEKAAEQNNPKHVYLHAAEMYERAGEVTEAEEIFRNILAKRFKYSKKVWMRYHLFVLQQDPTEAMELLRRSLQCLSRHKHAFVISHYAQAEFEHGSVDRGRTIFDGLLSSFPKRLDLWNMYVDKEVKSGHIEAARRLLDRMCTLRLSAQKMKNVMKKYVQLELVHGDIQSVERVKSKAREFVESNLHY